eukprot:735255-Alexandrium_andersonii.AAC.1
MVLAAAMPPSDAESGAEVTVALKRLSKVYSVHELAEAARPRPLANEVCAPCWANSGGRRAP